MSLYIQGCRHRVILQMGIGPLGYCPGFEPFLLQRSEFRVDSIRCPECGGKIAAIQVPALNKGIIPCLAYDCLRPPP